MGRKKLKGGSEIPLPPDKMVIVGGVAGLDGSAPHDNSEDPNLRWKIEALNRAMEELTERQREVITMRFWEGLTQDLVAKRLNISRSGVNQIEQKSIKKLSKSKFIVKH